MRWIRSIHTFVIGATALACTLPALAVDGVIEINQARVVAGGVTPGDSPGGAVTIDLPGSYRLTGDLSFPSTDAFHILSDDVTLDLNGFTVRGSVTAPLSDGIGLFGHSNIEIRNGTVAAFSRHGIFGNAFSNLPRVLNVRALGNVASGIEVQGAGSLVDGCTASGNQTGIRILDGAILNSIASRNTGFGLVMTLTCGYRSNVATENNGGNANPQVAGTGNELGPNVCGTDLTCP